jgi:hypothetical protein
MTKPIYSETSILIVCECASHPQQHSLVRTAAKPVEAQYRQLIPPQAGIYPDLFRNRGGSRTEQQVIDTNRKHRGDLRKICTDLPGTPGLPLCNRTPRNPDSGRQAVLR